MKVYRTIYTDTLQIDFSNTGLHWTSSPEYIHTGGCEKGVTEQKRYQVTLIAEIDETLINASATAESRKEYPNEQEVVMLQNQIVECELWAFDTEDFEDIIEGEYFTICTGTRCDSWVLEF